MNVEYQIMGHDDTGCEGLCVMIGDEDSNAVFGALWAWCEPVDGELWIDNIVIGEEYRRRGFGKKLLEYAEKLSKGVFTVKTSAKEDDTVTQMFLRACGYRCYAIREDNDLGVVYVFAKTVINNVVVEF